MVRGNLINYLSVKAAHHLKQLTSEKVGYVQNYDRKHVIVTLERGF